MPNALEPRYERIPVDKVVPNERNPRTAPNFTAEELLGLRRSIEEMGVMIPIIVQKYEQDLYMLIEGERRWTVAKLMGMKEISAIVLSSKLTPDEQVAVMSHLHEHRKGWDAADHLLAVQVFMANQPDLSVTEAADKLGIKPGTLNDRIFVLGMGKEVVNKIARGKLDTTTALRTGQLVTKIVKERPALAKDLGGEKGVQRKLLAKAEARTGGVSQEYTAIKPDVADIENVSDETLKSYITTPKMTAREMRLAAPAAVSQRAVLTPMVKRAQLLAQDIHELARQDLSVDRNLQTLRIALERLTKEAFLMSSRIEKLLDEEDPPEAPKPPRRPAAKKQPLMRAIGGRRIDLNSGAVEADRQEKERVRRESGEGV